MKIDYDARYFSPKDVLECGQIFRFEEFERGYKVFSADRACYVYTEGKKTFIECDDGDYFYNFFDLGRDYAAINESAKAFGVPLLARGAELGAGIRLLNQDAEEMIFSFIVSQNNNIPRIRGIVERLCERFGAPIPGGGFSFPAPQALAGCSAEELAPLRAGFRAKYVLDAARRVAAGEIDFDTLRVLPLENARAKLEEICGVGPKVADCTLLYGLHRLDAFPVDVWVRRALAAYLPGADPKEFGEAAGLLQQVLFVRIRAENGRSG